MKRYLLFAGKEYYPNGGLLDLKLALDTFQEVKAAIIWTDFPKPGSRYVRYPESYQIDPDINGDGKFFVSLTDITFQVLGSTTEEFDWYQIVDTQELCIAEMYSSYGNYVDEKYAFPINRKFLPRDIWG